MPDSTERPPAITFFLERVGAAWRVERLKVAVPGQPIKEHVRAGAWPSNAAMEPLAATLALFKIKEARAEFPCLKAEDSSERILVERCATLWRNANGTSAKWVNVVFSGLLEPGAKGTSALQKLICVQGSKGSRIVSLAEGRLAGQVDFRIGRVAASLTQLQAFVNAVRGPVEPEIAPRAAAASDIPQVTGPAHVTKTNVATSSKARVNRENIYRRPCIAVDGPRDVSAEGLGDVVDDLGELLAKCEWHVIHGPHGTGIDAVTAAITKHGARTLTHTLIIGSTEEFWSGADVVLLLGGIQDLFTHEPTDREFLRGPGPSSIGLSEMPHSTEAMLFEEPDRKCFNRTCSGVVLTSWHRGELSVLLWKMLREIAEEIGGQQPAGSGLDEAHGRERRPRGRLRLVRVLYLGQLESRRRKTK